MNSTAVSKWHEKLLAGECCAINTQSGELVVTPPAPSPKEPRLIFPGAFNPLHDGHRAMADAAEEILSGEVEFELSIDNVDKPPRSPAQIQQGLQQFPPTQITWLTRAIRFRDKAELFPGATFIVGADTITRIGDARYYGNDVEALRVALDDFVRLGCRFLVFGRSRGEEFQQLSSLDLPPALATLCWEVPAERFRFDVSSSEIRIAGRCDG